MCNLENAPTEYIRDKLKGGQAATSSGIATVIVQPGIILGPYEGRGGRLPTWLARMDRGGPTLVSEPQDAPLQFVDGRDLARFM